MGMLRDIHIFLQIITHPRAKHFVVQEICPDVPDTVDKQTKMSFPSFFVET